MTPLPGGSDRTTNPDFGMTFFCIMYTSKQVYTFRGKTTLMRGGTLEQSNMERALHGPLAVKPASYSKERNEFLHLLLKQFK